QWYKSTRRVSPLLPQKDRRLLPPPPPRRDLALLRILLRFHAQLPLRRFREGRARPLGCPIYHRNSSTQRDAASAPLARNYSARAEITRQRHSVPTCEPHRALLPNRHHLRVVLPVQPYLFIILEHLHARSESHQPQFSQHFVSVRRRSHFHCVSLK